MAYNAVNIAPQQGFGAYGAVPGSIGLPSPASDLATQYPNLGQTNQQLSQNVLNESRGMLSPETVNNIQDTAAQWGVGSGMPGFGSSGSGLGLNLGLRSLGLTSQALQQQGLGDYLNLSGGISKTQTLNPELQAGIAARNAQFQAAPNPEQATTQLKTDYLTGLNQFNPKVGSRLPAHISTPPNLTPPGFGPTPSGGPLSGYNQSVVGALPGTVSGPAAASPLVGGNMYGGGGFDSGDPNDPNSSAYDPFTPFGTNPQNFGVNYGPEDQYGALGYEQPGSTSGFPDLDALTNQ